ncbi:MAG TPA: hypothetical protein PKK76_02890 [Leptospiraceae bacterium]|nr:hypothetical protein [Leptospiraceae bacterium]HNN59965.1 hypothetical protein [Leptospiraceae bacterium]
MKRLLLSITLCMSSTIACTTTSGLLDPRGSSDGKRITARKSELTFYCFWASLHWIDVECEVSASNILQCRKMNPSFQLRDAIIVEGKKL